MSIHELHATRSDRRRRPDRLQLRYALAREGIASVLLERDSVPGGLIRSGHTEGVLPLAARRTAISTLGDLEWPCILVRNGHVPRR